MVEPRKVEGTVSLTTCLSRAAEPIDQYYERALWVDKGLFTRRLVYGS